MAHAEKRTYDKRARKWRYRGRYKLPNGQWGSVSRDDEGKPFYTERSAEEFAHGLEVDVRRKVFLNPQDGKITVAEWVDIWIESIELSPLSLRDYKSRLRAVILPAWGRTPIRDITPVAYRTWELSLSKQGYAENSISGVRTVFRTLLQDAVASKLRADNPIPDGTAGRRGKYKSKRNTEEKVYPNAHQALLVARNGLALRGASMYALVLTSFYTGLRIGELAGLTQDRLQLEDTGHGARILLKYQSQYIDGKPTLVPAKYDSERGLIINPGLAALLQELVRSRPGEFVFTAPKGGRLLIGGDFYSDTWRPMVDGRAPKPQVRGRRAQPGIRPVVGVEGMVPHGLRHGQKVLLDEAGHPRVAVEERMGHTLQGVEGTYSHTTLGMEMAIAKSLQSSWEEALSLPDEGYGPVPVDADSEKLISQESPRRVRKPPRRPGELLRKTADRAS
ncbi:MULTISPECIES: tyrosine-type recombinase/integrase [Streptomyces]|uniref:tyrosine-type recombinase/integrase n=1 Tax=Streptomyces TaxID=1883 RepID=UPI000A4C26A7|nr:MULTISPECIES: tyrosine-type recombinase/integrase [Streptomyces]